MKRSKVRGLSALLVPGAIVVIATACSSSDPGPGEGTGGTAGATGGATGSGGATNGATGGGTASGGTTAGVGGGTSTGGGFQSTGGTSSYCETHADDLTPPFPVQVEDGPGFIPSGWMGDAASVAAVACPDRAPGAAGVCSGFTHSPGGTMGWAGVRWQFPTNNWGDDPGLCIADGATKVRFYAKATTDDVKVAFGATSVMGTTTGDITLTTEWAPYEITLTEYNLGPAGGTINGFDWAAASPMSAATFYIDDIQWITADGGLGGAGPE